MVSIKTIPAFVLVFSVLVLLPASALAQSEDEGWFEGDTYEDEQWVDQGQGPSSEPEIDENYFFDQLAPYGDWIWTPEHEWVWRPTGVSAGWRPYTYGQWSYTEYGWTWSSYYPWGWAAFHYGRWAWIEQMGWVWVPGQTWGPAWVMWRYSGRYVGWSPLLAGYDSWYGWAYYPVFYSYWTFVDWGHFCDSYPNHHYIPRRRSKDVFRHTYFPKRCRDGAGGACVRGPSRNIVQKVTRRKIPVRHMENTAPRSLRQLGNTRPNKTKLGLSGNTLRVFRPRTLTPKGTRASTRKAKTWPSRSVDLGIIPNRTDRPIKPTALPQQTDAFSPADHQYPKAKPGASIKPTRPPRPGPYGTAQPYDTKMHPAYNKHAPSMRKAPAPGSHKMAPTHTRTHRLPSARPVPKRSSSSPKVYKPSKSSSKSYKPSKSTRTRSKSSFHPSRSSSRSRSSSSHSSHGSSRHRRIR